MSEYCINPTDMEVRDYLKKLKILPLRIEYIKYMALVAYESNNEIGLLFIIRDYRNNGRLNHARCASNRNMKEQISLMLSSWGDLDKEQVAVAMVVFNDKELITKACKISVVFDGKTKDMEINEQKGAFIIIIGDSDIFDLRLDQLTVYDAENNIIYSKSY